MVLLFKDEIQNEEVVAQAPMDTLAATEGYRLVGQTIQLRYPNDRLLALYPDEKSSQIVTARIGTEGSTKLRGSAKVPFDLSTGKELGVLPTPASGFFDWVLVLHREVFLGSTGKLYLGFVGLIYLFMLLSGFFLYGKFMKGRAFGEVRRGIPKLADLHKFLGVITFGWGLVIGLSGVFLAFNGVLIKYFQAQTLKSLTAEFRGSGTSSSVIPDLGKVVQSALNGKRDSSVSYISFPDTEYGLPGHFLLLMKGGTTFTEKISEMAVVNAQSGLLTKTVELPLYLKFVLVSEPLHFGDYGGPPLKILWALFALSSQAVVVLGIASYFRKRKKVALAKVPQRPFQSEFRHPYAKPVTLSLLTAFAIVFSLFGNGIPAQAAVFLLVIPLFAFFRVRRHA